MKNNAVWISDLENELKILLEAYKNIEYGFKPKEKRKIAELKIKYDIKTEEGS